MRAFLYCVAICWFSQSSFRLWGDDSATLLRSIRLSRESRVSEVSSAEIRYFWTVIDCTVPDQPPLTLNDFEERLSGVTWRADVEFVRSLIGQLNPALYTKYLEHDQRRSPWVLWEEVQFSTDGLQARSAGEVDEHLISRGLQLRYAKQLQGQVDAWELGASSYYFHDLAWFQGLFSDQLFTVVQEVQQGTDEVTLVLEENQTLVLDAETLLPIRLQQISDSAGNGKLVLFFEPTLFPGDVMLPTFRIQATVREGLVKRVEMTAIAGAEFNVNIPEERFRLPVPAGKLLVDFRSPNRIRERVTRPLVDAAEFFLAGELGRVTVGERELPPGMQPAGGGWKSFLLIANGLFLITLGLILWKRSRAINVSS